MSVHARPSLTSQSSTIRRCCVDRLNPPPKADIGLDKHPVRVTNTAADPSLSAGGNATGKSNGYLEERAMTFPRRGFLQLAAGTVALAAFAPIASAQTYPSRPITMVVPFPAAGPADVLARILAERMRETLGQPVVIENVTGAAGSIATGRVVRAIADGYTLILGNLGTHVVNGAIYPLQDRKSTRLNSSHL